LIGRRRLRWATPSFLLLVVGCWLLVVGCWLLVVGCWLLLLLVVGCWLLAVVAVAVGRRMHHKMNYLVRSHRNQGVRLVMWRTMDCSNHLKSTLGRWLFTTMPSAWPCLTSRASAVRTSSEPRLTLLFSLSLTLWLSTNTSGDLGIMQACLLTKLAEYYFTRGQPRNAFKVQTDRPGQSSTCHPPIHDLFSPFTDRSHSV